MCLSAPGIVPQARAWRNRAHRPCLAVADDRQQACRQRLAELHAPLVEGVDVPDRALHENLVLVERDQPAERLGVEPAVEQRVGRPVARKDLVRQRAARAPRRRGRTSPAPRAPPPPSCRRRAPRSARGSWRRAWRGGRPAPRAARRRAGNRPGTISVPWCRSWKKACWPLVPGSPQTIGPVRYSTSRDSRVTRLPFNSMSSCWRCAAKRDEALVVGEHRMRAEIPDVAVPDAEQAHDDRQVLGRAARCGNARPWRARRRGRRGNSRAPMEMASGRPIADHTE